MANEYEGLTFLLEASSLLASSLDFETTLASVAQLAVPRFADWAAVDMLEEGKIRRLGVAHTDPEKIRLAYELDRQYPPDLSASIGLPRVLRTGAPEFYGEIPEWLLEASAQNPEHLEMIRSLGLRSAMCVPLVSRGRTLGAITLVMAESGRVYREEDLPLVLALASRAADAIDNARLYQLAQQEIAERRRVEQALRERDDQLRLALEAANMGAWDWNVRTDELRWSENLEPLHGVEPGTFGGTFEAFLDLVYEEDRPRLLEAVREALAEGASFDVEFRNIHGDGSVHWIAGRGQLFRDEDGQPLRMVGMGLDVTDRKRLQEELQQRARELTEMDRLKDQFLAVLSHELRTPLSAMSSALFLLRERAADDAALQRPCDILQRQLGQVTRLVGDLQDVARLKQGRLEVRFQALDVRAILQDAVEATRPLFEERGHQLTPMMGADPLPVQGDSARLLQVFCNLLNNAARYTDPGGSVSVDAALEGECVLVRVADSGIGIDPDALPQIFDLFMQGDGARGRSPEGLGIGLALVRGLVEMHGGSIRAASEGPNRGSRFEVRLPAVIS